MKNTQRGEKNSFHIYFRRKKKIKPKFPQKPNDLMSVDNTTARKSNKLVNTADGGNENWHRKKTICIKVFFLWAELSVHPKKFQVFTLAETKGYYLK